MTTRLPRVWLYGNIQVECFFLGDVRKEMRKLLELGLTIKKLTMHGTWNCHDGDPAFVTEHEITLDNIFPTTVRTGGFDGDPKRVRCKMTDDASIRITAGLPD